MAKVSSTDSVLLIYLPTQLVKILDLRRGNHLDIFVDVTHQEILLQKWDVDEGIMEDTARGIVNIGATKITGTSAKNGRNLLIYLRKKLVETLKVRKGEWLRIFVDEINQRVIMQRTHLGGSQEVTKG